MPRDSSERFFSGHRYFIQVMENKMPYSYVFRTLEDRNTAANILEIKE